MRPDSAEALAALIAEAADKATPLAFRGAGSRSGFGQAEGELIDLSALSGIIDHDPAELVLTAAAATPVADVVARLAAAGQALAFEPPDLAPLWGGAPGAGTLGGLFATGISGPRRLVAGGARDHLLGLAAINGRGERFVAGGKVLKNVTGYDLPKLMTGAMGTLGVLTEVSVKVLPAAGASGSLVYAARDAAAAVALLAEALSVDCGISGAAWIGPGMDDEGPRAVLRIEAAADVLPALADAVLKRLPGGQWQHATEPLWQRIAGVHSFARADDAVWRLGLPPVLAPALVAALPAAARVLLDWGGARAWLLLPPALEALDVHALVARAAAGEGHARRLRGAGPVPALVPLPAPLAALSARVKASFDPAGILNRGLDPAEAA